MHRDLDTVWVGCGSGIRTGGMGLGYPYALLEVVAQGGGDGVMNIELKRVVIGLTTAQRLQGMMRPWAYVGWGVGG